MHGRLVRNSVGQIGAKRTQALVDDVSLGEAVVLVVSKRPYGRCCETKAGLLLMLLYELFVNRPFACSQPSSRRRGSFRSR